MTPEEKADLQRFGAVARQRAAAAARCSVSEVSADTRPQRPCCGQRARGLCWLDGAVAPGLHALAWDRGRLFL